MGQRVFVSESHEAFDGHDAPSHSVTVLAVDQSVQPRDSGVLQFVSRDSIGEGVPDLFGFLKRPPGRFRSGHRAAASATEGGAAESRSFHHDH